MRFNLFIDVDNDAFQPAPYEETARILRAIADRLDTVVLAPVKKSGAASDALGDYGDRRGGWTGHYQTVLDINGNDVGRYAFKEKE